MKLQIGIACILILLACGCSDDYYTDGGLLDESVGELGVSTMDYLEENSAEFDTLVMLINLCELDSEVNASGNTFFAPRDYSIHNYFELIFSDLAEWPELTALDADEVEEISNILQNYIIPEQEILQEDLSTAYSYSTTYAGKSARFNVTQDDYLGNVNMGAKHIVFSLDKSNDGEDVVYQSVQVVTSNMKSTNGIVHVLDSDTHIFGFN